MSPQIIFGTATFGMDKTEFEDESNVSSVLGLLKDSGVRRLDSAARYPPLNPGRSEELIGESQGADPSFLIDTKVYTDSSTDGSGDLTTDAIEKSVTNSLVRLRRESEGVNILHIHRADPSTPVAEQVRAFNQQIKKGRCKAWGVSSVPVPMLEEMLRVCEEEGLQKPVCYQGEYNIITRGAETRLLPLLRKHNMAFNAFRPLAAGFLTGNFVKGNIAGTRFAEDNPIGKAVQKLFSAEDLHTAIKDFDQKVTQYHLAVFEVAVRWIFHHSALTEADGVVLGASKKTQIEEVIAISRRGPLPHDIVRLSEQLWLAVAEGRGSIV